MTHHIERMLEASPIGTSFDRGSLTDCIEACFECAQTCAACARACLGEEDVAELAECIRLDLQCADVCETTGKLLLRATADDMELLRLQLDACARACATCGDECERHAEMHEHCRVCAEACRRCAEACEQLTAV